MRGPHFFLTDTDIHITKRTSVILNFFSERNRGPGRRICKRLSSNINRISEDIYRNPNLRRRRWRGLVDDELFGVEDATITGGR